MPKGHDSAPATPLLAGDSREADSCLPNMLITSFYQKVGQKVEKAPSLQQITEQITEQINKQIELEMQLESQGVALDQDQEHEPVLVALALEDGGEESYDRCLERDSEIRAAESVKIDSAGSSTTVLAAEQSYRKSRRTPKGQQSALERLRMESEPRGPQRRKGHEPLQESSHHRRPSGQHMTANNELGDIGVSGSGIPEGKSDYLNDSSLLFLDYMLPDVPCSPIAKAGPCGRSKVRSSPFPVITRGRHAIKEDEAAHTVQPPGPPVADPRVAATGVVLVDVTPLSLVFFCTPSGVTVFSRISLGPNDPLRVSHL
ncbi:hypothetical protein NDU88_003517 [Pleurodeles waltl]|uniref:Uncharacterized protein n=1 Tax=Pleurodeles waltl TaxID=8319 RepID=A0AAV7MUI0_PLEWA|nr:hypothetical protein NDU88_003517 [Pleurodeles waltl]